MAEGVQRSLVLCVEDDPTLRHLIQLALRLDPLIDVQAVGSGHEAVALLQSGVQPDVIMIDFRLPGLTGVAVLDQLRGLIEGRSPTIIFCTATQGRADHKAMREAGAAGIIMKPFDPLTLASRVRAYLSN